MSANLEDSTIALFSSKFNGDDGALVGRLVFSKDLFLEGTHFKRGWLSWREVGKKAVAVNVSDSVAMNAVAKFALLGLGLPRNFSPAERDALCGGIKDACAEFGVEVVGGDTVASEKVFISLTIVAVVGDGRRALFRTPSKLGDMLFFTGVLGGGLKGFLRLSRGGVVSPKGRFRSVVLRDGFLLGRGRGMHDVSGGFGGRNSRGFVRGFVGGALGGAARFVRCCMDISDGLASDLPKITKGFGVKFARKFTKSEFVSGEEYELLFTAPARHKARLFNEAKRARVKLNLLGRLVKGKVKTHGKFSHF